VKSADADVKMSTTQLFRSLPHQSQNNIVINQLLE